MAPLVRQGSPVVTRSGLRRVAPRCRGGPPRSRGVRPWPPVYGPPVGPPRGPPARAPPRGTPHRGVPLSFLDPSSPRGCPSRGLHPPPRPGLPRCSPSRSPVPGWTVAFSPGLPRAAPGWPPACSPVPPQARPRESPRHGGIAASPVAPSLPAVCGITAPPRSPPSLGPLAPPSRLHRGIRQPVLCRHLPPSTPLRSPPMPPRTTVALNQIRCGDQVESFPPHLRNAHVTYWNH